MSEARIDGRPVTLEAAVAQAAKLLAASRLPVFAGLGTDIAGARATIALAERIGGAIDHMHSDAALRDLAAMREAGMMVVTPNEARMRADTLLAVGTALTAVPELAGNLPAFAEAAKRRVFWLCPGRARASSLASDKDIRIIGRNVDDLPVLLAALRARVAGRPVGATPLSARTLDRLAHDLQAARFGVAVWSAAELDALVIEMLCGLVDDLNTKTRFSGVPLRPLDNAAGVTETCGWMTGFPPRTAFARGHAEHDPWRFATRRLVDSREADCVLWISAYRAAPPDWAGDVPTVALTAQGASFRTPPRVHIAVGRPGIDHDTVEHLPVTGTLAPRPAAAPSGAVSVAQAITRIAAALPQRGAPC